MVKGTAIIKIQSTDLEELGKYIAQIKDVAVRTDGKFVGPVPLPTLHMKVPVRKGPDGGGTSSIDRWEMRVHRRLIKVTGDDRTFHHLMRIPISLEKINLTFKLSEREQ